MPERENIKIVSIGWKIMKKKPEFQRKRSGKDSQIIITLIGKRLFLFGANVNPLGLSGQVKKRSRRTSGYHQQLSRQRLYRSEKKQLLHIPIPRRNILLSEMVLRSLSHFWSASAHQKERCFWDRPIPNMQESWIWSAAHWNIIIWKKNRISDWIFPIWPIHWKVILIFWSSVIRTTRPLQPSVPLIWKSC
mgnify:CR=1 FL=1